MEHLGTDIARLAALSPHRGKALLTRLAQSEDASRRYVAVAAAIPYGQIDYEFTRDMLFAIHKRDVRDGDFDGVMPWVIHLRAVLRQLRPEQAEDLDQRWYDFDPDE